MKPFILLMAALTLALPSAYAKEPLSLAALVAASRGLQAELDRTPDDINSIKAKARDLGLDVVSISPSPEAPPIHLIPGAAKPFRDCPTTNVCPQMVVIPASPPGFKIGSPPTEQGRLPSEDQHTVSIRAFAIGKYEVSVDEYMACVAAGACRHPEWLEPDGPHNIETGSGVTYRSLAPYIRGDKQPIVGISWDDAAAYAAWLAQVTGQPYRLPSEAEWEFAARAGSSGPYWWGNEPKPGDEPMACCRGCGSSLDGIGFFPVDSFKPNPWGLHNVHGNVWEWVADDYCESYASGPSDGSARAHATCPTPLASQPLKVFRGGSCFYEPRQMRAAMRLRNWASFRNMTLGFRVARSLAP